MSETKYLIYQKGCILILGERIKLIVQQFYRSPPMYCMGLLLDIYIDLKLCIESKRLPTDGQGPFLPMKEERSFFKGHLRRNR